MYEGAKVGMCEKGEHGEGKLLGVILTIK